MDKEIQANNGGLTCGMRGQVLLNQALPTSFGEKEKEREKKIDF